MLRLNNKHAMHHVILLMSVIGVGLDVYMNMREASAYITVIANAIWVYHG